jgi:ABC-type sulfate/molybdate transport systems ATPase subunit
MPHNHLTAVAANKPLDSAHAVGGIPALEITARKRLGETQIDVDFVSAGRVTALFGPSGSGKTSIVNMIAGLLKPDRGRVVVSGRISTPAPEFRFRCISDALGTFFRKRACFRT